MIDKAIEPGKKSTEKYLHKKRGQDYRQKNANVLTIKRKENQEKANNLLLIQSGLREPAVQLI